MSYSTFLNLPNFYMYLTFNLLMLMLHIPLKLISLKFLKINLRSEQFWIYLSQGYVYSCETFRKLKRTTGTTDYKSLLVVFGLTLLLLLWYLLIWPAFLSFNPHPLLVPYAAAGVFLLQGGWFHYVFQFLARKQGFPEAPALYGKIFTSPNLAQFWSYEWNRVMAD